MEGLLDHGLNLILVGNVRTHRPRAAIEGFLPVWPRGVNALHGGLHSILRGAHISQRHAHSPTCQGRRYGQPDAAHPAGHQRSAVPFHIIHGDWTSLPQAQLRILAASSRD